MLDVRIEKILTDFTHELCQLLGEELITVALYGSAAGVNFVPGVSDFNIAIVVKEVRFEILQKLQPRMAAWHTRGFAVPLVIDREFLHRGGDVFPIEFSDIQRHHHLLWGEDIFQTLTISLRHVRFLAEHEVRSKLLRLQALYFERADDPQRLRQVMLDSLKTFLMLMRHLLRLQGDSGAQPYAEVLADSALSRLLAISENYPQLKADAQFARLSDELAGTENRIATERRRYNEAVQTYNTYIKSIPAVVYAGWLGFTQEKYFEVPKEAQRVPKVKF